VPARLNYGAGGCRRENPSTPTRVPSQLGRTRRQLPVHDLPGIGIDYASLGRPGVHIQTNITYDFVQLGPPKFDCG